MSLELSRQKPAGAAPVPDSKGHLNPGSEEVRLDRFELEPALDHLVRHIWVARWEVPSGEVRPQRVLSYPAFNAVITPERADIHGPDSRLQVRKLRGSSWVVGVLFRAAAGPRLTRSEPRLLVGKSEPLQGAPTEDVRRIMSAATYDRAALAPVLNTWLGPMAAGVDERGMLANRACRIAEEAPGLNRAADLADKLGISERSLERLVRDTVGLTPKWLIECRRLQQAATTLFASRETDLTRLAGDLGYSDYAHFSRRYRQVLGESPRATRDRSD